MSLFFFFFWPALYVLILIFFRKALTSSTPLVQQLRHHGQYQYQNEIPEVDRRWERWQRVETHQFVTKIQCDRKDGKEKACMDVPARFYRLPWGGWIRPRAGRRKRLWRKTSKYRYDLQQHVFLSKTQSKTLDRMVTKYWRDPKYWVDNPYEPYHHRNNYAPLPEKPRPFFP